MLPQNISDCAIFTFDFNKCFPGFTLGQIATGRRNFLLVSLCKFGNFFDQLKIEFDRPFCVATTLSRPSNTGLVWNGQSPNLPNIIFRIICFSE